jgi:hypothetical protein
LEPVRRRAARYRVYLSVRYEAAADFVREYAENLSRGGLFIRNARGLSRHRDVMVEIELPGYGLYQVRAEVMHVIGDALATEHGRTPGAGLAIREAPNGFEEALSGYLIRLGRRGESLVLAAETETARLLHAAGYQVEAVESPDAVPEAISRSGAPLVGVVVPVPRLTEFRRAARDSETAELTVGIDASSRIDDILVQLDRRL